MICVCHHKTFYSSGHAVVAMAQEEMERLETFPKRFCKLDRLENDFGFDKHPALLTFCGR